MDLQSCTRIQLIIHVELLVGLFSRLLVSIGDLCLGQLAGRSIHIGRAFDETLHNFAILAANLSQLVLGHMVGEFFEEKYVLASYCSCSGTHGDLRLVCGHVHLLFDGISFEPLDS